MKVPAIVAVYYEYLIENDEVGLEYVPIPLRKQVRRLLRANPVYRAKHPEIMPKTEETPAANPAPASPKEDGGKKNEKAASEETE
jgi:hypothetical protein